MKERVIKIPEKCMICDMRSRVIEDRDNWTMYCYTYQRVMVNVDISKCKPHWCKAIEVIVREKE